MIKTAAVIFDFDGVLVESVDVKTRAFADMYAAYGEDVVRRVVQYHLEQGGLSRFKKFRYFQEMILGESLSQEKETALGETFSRLVKDAVVRAPWVPGAFEFLTEYLGKIDMFVASGTPDDEMKEIVQRRGMAHFFVSVNGTPATKSEIINRICIEHRFERKAVLMVGDALTDYDGAQSSGVRFVGRSADGRGFFPADVPIIKDLKELHKYC